MIRKECCLKWLSETIRGILLLNAGFWWRKFQTGYFTCLFYFQWDKNLLTSNLVFNMYFWDKLVASVWGHVLKAILRMIPDSENWNPELQKKNREPIFENKTKGGFFFVFFLHPLTTSAFVSVTFPLISLSVLKIFRRDRRTRGSCSGWETTAAITQTQSLVWTDTSLGSTHGPVTSHVC